MRIFFVVILMLFASGTVLGQELSPFPVNDEWLSKIDSLSPDKAELGEISIKKMLIFSLHTGYEHWTIPHTEAVIKILAEKSGVFIVESSKDIKQFSPEALQGYDVVVLNNNCSKRDKRNIFWDVLQANDTLSEAAKRNSAQRFEKNLLEYVHNGGGLVVLHGGITMQNHSKAFGEMIGGSFDYHPPQQKITVKLVDAEHPMVLGFKGKAFVHVDEPYFFKGAYEDTHFRPLLYMDEQQLTDTRDVVEDKKRYLSWIKRYGQGRVFYAAPTHNAQSYGNPKLLEFLSNGLLYAVGKLDCDDSPIDD